MSDKIKKSEMPNKGLVKPSGAPDLKKMQSKVGKIAPLGGLGMMGNSLGLSPSLQLLMMFDITGSMFGYFDLIRSKLKEIITVVKGKASQAEFSVFAYRNHGDELGYKEVYYTFPLTSDQDTLFSQIETIEKGGGGPDALTCMEDCLQEANNINWKMQCPKALVIIGDQPPHGVVDPMSKCPKEINYKLEIEKLGNKEVKIYTVFCPGAEERTVNFYRETAQKNGGRFLQIEEIDLLKELIIAICMKETGKMEEYIKDLEIKNQLTPIRKKAILMLKK
ncbi:VWA domain-containing protein [Candidatus Falkowbacteria bacterium]|nr:VWA domain-containing protein [Candidatus Falkowbacteria bacterium]